MNDEEKLRRYYASEIDRTARIAPPADLIKSAAVSTGVRTGLGWENIFGLLVTIGYLLYFINPLNWFSLGRIFLVLVNGLSFSQFIWGFGIGF